MYLTAQRVAPYGDSTPSAINTFLYLTHDGRSYMDVRDAILADGSPGELERQNCNVAPGGNAVHSYLDVVTRASRPTREIMAAVLAHPHPDPCHRAVHADGRFGSTWEAYHWEHEGVWCRARMGVLVSPSLAERREEVVLLGTHIVQLLAAHRYDFDGVLNTSMLGRLEA